MDKTIKCLNRADFGDRMKYLKISKQTTRSNIYLNLNITNEAFVCQNKVIQFDDLCIDKKALTDHDCVTKSKALISL